MNRLVLFSFYDKEGIADEYVYYLLQELKTIATKLVVVINGDINSEDKFRMSEIADFLIQRQNKGYDSGAYKEVLFRYFGIDSIKQYDELVLCNDTFYGPLVPMKNIFSHFEEKRADFWGLHLWQSGYLNWISSFFLVFRKDILADERFYDYWEKNIDYDAEGINEVYATFETGLFYELCEMGYTYEVYAKEGTYHIMKSPDYAIEKYNTPFLKKKVFASEFYSKENVCKSLVEIGRLSNYDIELIIKSVRRKYNLDVCQKGDVGIQTTEEFYTVLPDYKASTLRELKDFCSARQEETIYLYGAGVVASKIYFLLRKHIKIFGGFVVSKESEQQKLFGFPVCEYKDEYHKDKAMIVALGAAFSDEVKKRLGTPKNVVYVWEKNNEEV